MSMISILVECSKCPAQFIKPLNEHIPESKVLEILKRNDWDYADYNYYCPKCKELLC